MKLLPLALLVCSAVALSFGFVSSAQADPLKVGDSAPMVSGTTEKGTPLNLGDVYKQQPYTLVYFYPKAGTKGCTAQGCSLRDAYEKLQAKGVAVIGVSTDSVEAQEAFKDKQHFPFPLIADTDKTVIKAFGVPLMMRGVVSMATRQAYLIKDGKIVWADYKASTDKQADDVLKVIGS
jgi:thioredoxin-dependent peroxiredoxin